MAIAFVKNVGSANVSNATTAVVTVPAGGVAAGNIMVIRTVRGASATVVSSIVDSRGGNSYSEFVADTAGSPSVATWLGVIAVALQSGDTITTTFASKGGCGTVIDEFSGITSTGDGSNHGSGSSATPSSGAIASPASNDDLFVGAVAVVSGGADSFTEDTDTDGGAGWNSLTRGNWGGGTTNAYRSAYKIATAAASQTYNPALGTSRVWVATISALKAPSVNIPYLVTARRV